MALVKILRVGNSHTRRELKITKEKQPNVSFPGGSLLDEEMFCRVSGAMASRAGKGYQHVVFQFGGNEVYEEALPLPPFEGKKTNYAGMPNAQHIILNIERKQNGVWDPADPCNTFFFYQGELKQRLENFVKRFLGKLQEVIAILGVKKVTIICPGPRMLRTREEAGKYNLVAYFLACCLKRQISEECLQGIQYRVFDPFVMTWGSHLGDREARMDSLHNPKEVKDTRKKISKYGATHYSDAVYWGISEGLQELEFA